MSIQIYQATVIFPAERPKPSKFNDSLYYTLCLNLPPGAPGTKHDPKYDEHKAYLNFNEGSAEEGYLRSLKKGDVLQVAYDTSGKSPRYMAILSEEQLAQPAPPQPKPAPSSAAASLPPERVAPAANGQGRPNDGLLSEADVAAHFIAQQQALHLIENAHLLVVESEVLGQLPPDVQQKHATTIFLYGKDRYRFIDPRQEGWSAGGDEALERARAAIFALDPSGLPGNLLAAIAQLSENIDSVEEAIAILKRFGLSRENIDPNDPSSWFDLYLIADGYAHKAAGGSAEQAAQEIAQQFSLEENNPF